MTAQNHRQQFPSFHIGDHDRLTIDGKAFRLVHQTNGAFVLCPADTSGVAETFAFGHLNRLNAAGKIKHERDYYVPPHLRIPKAGVPELSIALLPRAQRKRLDVRHALVRAFDDMLAEDLVRMNDKSIGACMNDIRERAGEYLKHEVDMELEHRKQLAKEGKARRPQGGDTSSTVNAVHPRTLRKWRSIYDRFGKAGLVDRISGRGNRTSFYSPEENALLMKTVNESYLSLNRPTIQTTFQDVKCAFRAENNARVAKGLSPFRTPSRQAVRGCIKKLDRFVVLVKRYGAQEAMKRLRPVGRGLEVCRPLERVEIDEWRIDLITIMAKAGLLAHFEDEELEVLGLKDETARWCLVAAIDCRTRIMLGMRLTNNPKTSAATGCLRMVVSDKGQFADAVGALTPWDQFGTPELVVTDNGAAFAATAFTNVCTDLGIGHERAIAGVPGMRGTIERFFQTAALNLLPRLSGRTFGDVITRGDHPSEDRACLTTEDLCTALVRWIVDIYHNTPHAGLGGRTPLQQWEADLEACNPPALAAPDARTKRLAFGRTKERQATQEGITVLGVRYHSQTLAVWFLEPRRRTVEVRWDEEDLGAIEVCLDDCWHEVAAVFDGFAGLHVREWIAVRRALRSKSASRAAWEEEVVMRAIEDIRALDARKRLEFNLIDKGLSEKEFGHLEQSLFASFRVTANVPKTRRPDDDFGHVIEPRRPDDPEDGGAMATVDNADAPAPVSARKNDWVLVAPKDFK